MDLLTLLVFSFVCALSDLRSGRIPNRLILCGLLLALFSRFGYVVFPERYAGHAELSGSYTVAELLRNANRIISDLAESAAQHPAAFLLDGCLGGLFAWIILGPLAALRMIGGGDVKLLSVIGFALGSRAGLKILWYSFIVAALWSAAMMIRNRKLLMRFGIFYRYIVAVIAQGRAIPYRVGGGDRILGARNLTAGNFDKSSLSEGSFEARFYYEKELCEKNIESTGEFSFAVPVFAALNFFLLFG